MIFVPSDINIDSMCQLQDATRRVANIKKKKKRDKDDDFKLSYVCSSGVDVDPKNDAPSEGEIHKDPCVSCLAINPWKRRRVTSRKTRFPFVERKESEQIICSNSLGK